MSKPYLSLIFPINKDFSFGDMLKIINADLFLQGVDFDYEILVLTSDKNKSIGSINKFIKAINNSKSIQVSESKIGELIRIGLNKANGALRSFSVSNDFGFLEEFSDYIPLFKTNDALIGPKWQLFSNTFYSQAISSLFHSPYQFLIIKEDTAPIICSDIKSEGWEFFTESHLRLLLSDKKIISAGSLAFPTFNETYTLHLFTKAATIRIQYLYQKLRNILWFMNKKIASAYQNLISRYQLLKNRKPEQ